MEFYAEEDKHLLPREFITPGATCGTVLVWSRDPRGDSASLLGVHATSAWGGDNGRRTYLGVRLRFPLRDPPSSLALLFSADATSRSVTDDIWRAFLTPILRPLGLGTPWYAGAGLAITKPSNEPTVTLYPAAVSGLEARIGPLRPFVEARFFGTDRPVFTMVTGLAVAMGDGND